jgi:hypothetical protein
LNASHDNDFRCFTWGNAMSLKLKVAGAAALAMMMTSTAPAFAQAPPVYGMVRFTSNCDAYVVVLVGGDPNNYARFRLGSGTVIDIKLPQGTTFAKTCGGWPAAQTQFKYVKFDQ